MTKHFKNIFKNKTVLVTGGTGSIGSEIVKQLIKHSPKQIRVFSRDESKHFFMQNNLADLDQKNIVRYIVGNVRDKIRLDEAIDGVNIIFHAAALKHLPYCEINPSEAIKTNIVGTQNIVEVAIKHKISKVISVSTDKAVSPHSLMGISKLMMERLVIAPHNYLNGINTKFCVVRFGNVLHSKGSVIPLWNSQIEKGGPVTVTSKKMKRFFMKTADAVNLLFSATKLMKGREIFVLKMRKYSIYDLAKKTIAEHPMGKNVKIIITGIREREKDEEFLYTDEEEKYMIATSKFFILQPSKELLIERKTKYPK